MKPIFHLIIYWVLIAAAVPFSAQPVITGDGFPVPGDTFLVSTDRLPHHILIGEPGEAKLWDFTSLQSPFARRALVLAFNNKSEITGLDYADAIMSGVGEEDVFVRFEDDKILEVGRKLPHPLQPGATINAVYEEPRVLFGQLAYGDKDVAEHLLTAPFTGSMDRLPTYLRKRVRKEADIRFVWRMRIGKHADAWGALRVPYKRYRVLRQKVNEKVTLDVEVRDATGEWRSAGTEGLRLAQPSQQDRTYYIFWSNELNHPPAIVYTEGSGMLRVEKIIYKAFPLYSRIIDAVPSGAEVVAYPNPTFDFVRFDFMNLPDGPYLIDIYNILGVRLQSFEVEVNGYTTAGFDLSDLKKGTYIYRIRNAQNRTITSKRLIIIQP